MSKKVFVLGAGFNRFIKEKLYGNIKKNIVEKFKFDLKKLGKIPKEISPPMAKDFIKYCLIKQFYDGECLFGIKEIVLNYIEEEFKFSRNVLLSPDSIDLEVLFIKVESQIDFATLNKDFERLNYLEQVRFNLINAICNALFSIEWGLSINEKNFLKKFGHIIYNSKSDVITLNYDCLAELGIELASGESKINKYGAPRFNWNRYSSYLIKFTKIRMPSGMGASSGGYYAASSGPNCAKQFYDKYHDHLPDIRFIKLHGSYNWYRYSSLVRNDILNPVGFGELAKSGMLYKKSNKFPNCLKNQVICFNGDWQYGVSPTLDHYRFRPRYKHILESILIPPIQFKEKEIRSGIFQLLWKSAKESLLNCEEIIFIGYSFPDTDHYVKKLFNEKCLKNKKITIVNPDHSVETKFRQISKFRGDIKWYDDGGDFIRNYDNG